MAKVKALDEKFFKYHKDNPHVLELLLMYTRQVKEAGFDTYSLNTIMNRVRWHVNIETKDIEGYKMNNNYSSRYARLIVLEAPEFEGFFNNRELQTESILDVKKSDVKKSDVKKSDINNNNDGFDY